MAISGLLSDFSLPEIFQFLEHGQKTGLLKLRESPGQGISNPLVHYVWFRQGRIVAAANQLDNQGLLSLMEKRGWITERAAEKVFAMHSTPMPIGLCLKAQGLVQAEQLKLLFYGQVIREVCALFRIATGQFAFDPHANLPMAEMTGLSQSAVEVTLTALRALKDWSALEEKLPLADSALMSVITGKPVLKLDAKEWQVWEFVNGNVAIKQIAKQLRLSLEEVLQIAFRLMVVNLAEEIPVPLMTMEPTARAIALETERMELNGDEKSKDFDKVSVSSSFLQSLVGFLRAKV